MEKSTPTAITCLSTAAGEVSAVGVGHGSSRMPARGRAENGLGGFLGQSSLCLVEKAAMLDANRRRYAATNPVRNTLRSVALCQSKAFCEGRRPAVKADDLSVFCDVFTSHDVNYTPCLNTCQQDG